MELPKIIVAGIITQDNKFFIAQRSKQDENYGKWEFPGGKLENNETDQECLKRELREELSIEAQIGRFVCSSYFEQNGIDYELKAYYVRSFSGTITLNEHQHMKWVTKEEFHSFEFPAPDLPIIEYLIHKVPATYFSAAKKQFLNLLLLTCVWGSVYFMTKERQQITLGHIQFFISFAIVYIFFGAFMNYYWQD